jgi:hypothetical protein
VIGTAGQTRNNDGESPGNNFQGSLRKASFRDAALALVNVGRGRLGAFFDRNTFFNANGVGTDITEADNRRFARNLFTWLTDATPPAVTSARFVESATPTLTIRFDDRVRGFARSDIILRNVIDGTAIPDQAWNVSVAEDSGRAILSIRIDAAQPAGRYQFRINAGFIADDSLNFTTSPIRISFTIK